MLPGLTLGARGSFHTTASLTNPPGTPYTNQSVSSFSTSKSIGTAAPDRLVVLALSTYDGGGSSNFTSITIGGITATILTVKASLCNATIAYARVPTGTTATISATLVGNCENILMDIFSLYGCVDLYATASNSRTTPSTTTIATSTTLTAPADSIVIGVVETGNDGSISWSSEVTRYSNQEINTTFNERFSTAAKLQTVALSGASITVTNAAAFARGALMVAAFY